MSAGTCAAIPFSQKQAGNEPRKKGILRTHGPSCVMLTLTLQFTGLTRGLIPQHQGGMFWSHPSPAGRSPLGPRAPSSLLVLSQWVRATPGTAAPSPSSGNKAIIEKFTAHVPGSTAHWAAVVSDSSRIPELLHAHRFHWSCGFAPSSQGQREVGDAHPPPCPQSPSPRMESMTSAHLLLYCLITLTKLTPRG